MPQRNTKLTFEEFLNKSREKHGDYYDYSQVEYINRKIKVKVICPEHGEFWIAPQDHFRGRGCKKCGIKHMIEAQRSNVQEFIEKAKKIHGEKYDYSKVEYVNAKTKIEIICPEHGSFFMVPYAHLSGKGCAECSNHIRITEEVFLKRIQQKYGNQYDLSKVNFVDLDTPITIICKEHGEFQKTPRNFLEHGCNRCGYTTLGISKRETTENFITKAKNVHGEKYDYTEVNVVNSYQPVKIICPEHGVFMQSTASHLIGHGCPECSKTFGLSEHKTVEALRSVFPNVVEQYKPEWLHSITSYQSIDVFLPDYNIGVEYQGIMHFQPNRKFGGEAGYKNVVERDQRKFQKCEENGVKLFYISFEKKLPEVYMAPIYKTTEDLISAINNYISEIHTPKRLENNV